MSTERVDKRRAAEILGCPPRTVVAMAARGDLAAAGAAKLCREWTFDEGRLRAYVRAKETEACRAARAIDALEKDLADLERQGNALLTTINVLREKAGQPPRPSFGGGGGPAPASSDRQHLSG